jgi:hypothetical protein
LFNRSVDHRLVNTAPAGLSACLAGKAFPFSVGACGQFSLKAQAVSLRKCINFLKNLNDCGPAHI